MAAEALFENRFESYDDEAVTICRQSVKSHSAACLNGFCSGFGLILADLHQRRNLHTMSLIGAFASPPLFQVTL